MTKKDNDKITYIRTHADKPNDELAKDLGTTVDVIKQLKKRNKIYKVHPDNTAVDTKC